MTKKKVTKKKVAAKATTFKFPPVPEVPIPKSLAAVADKYYTIREKRYAADKYAASLKKQESKLQEHLINNVKKGTQTGVRGKVCSVFVETVDKFNVVDWTKYWAYAKRTNRPEMFQRRLNEAAVTELLLDGKKVPGTEKIQVPKLRVSKV